MVARQISFYAGFLLLLFAILTRFVMLSHPSAVVFDEVHFGKFVTAYCCTGERFFDIHPPHAKLIIAAFAKLGGYEGDFDFDHIDEAYNVVSVVPLRTAPALFGALLPLLVYILLRQAKVPIELAFVGGATVLLDNAFVLQSRVISLDTILLSATFGSLVCWLAAQQKTGWKQLLLLIGAGGLAGIAVGSKFTGLTALALLGVLTLKNIVTARSFVQIRQWIFKGLLILAASFVVYSGGWILHYKLLTKPGSGDVWQVPSGHLVSDILEMHRKMFDANYNLTATHPYSSKWWTWPWMVRPVFYWQGDEGAKLYFLGNPVVWWGGTILFLIAILWNTLSFFQRGRISGRYEWIFFVGFLIAFLPFVRVPRALFLYHYMMPLVYTILFGITWLARKFEEKSIVWQPWVPVVMTLLIAGFILFSPITYAFPESSWQSLLFWFPTWR